MQKQTMFYQGQEVFLAKFDVIFKAIFIGEPELLASLLSSILNIPIKAEEMAILNTELFPEYEAGKLSRLDIRIKTADRHIDVEIQLGDKKNMAKRSLFYLSKLYVDQMKTNMAFNVLCPAIAINILDFNYLPYQDYHNRYRLKNIRNHDELTDAFEINFIELPKVPRETDNPKADNPKDIWMRFLAAEDGSVIEMLAEQNPVIEKAAQRLVYVSADEQVRYQMAMREKAELDYRSDMQDHFDMGKEEGINEGLQKGRQEGLQKGRQEGLQKGRQKGRQESRLEVARKLLSLNMSIAQVSDITGLTVDDVSRLK